MSMKVQKWCPHCGAQQFAVVGSRKNFEGKPQPTWLINCTECHKKSVVL